MGPQISMLVSSCDAYEDCWLPFFTLLATYWPSFDSPIYLNTETKCFSFPGLDIRCPRPELAARRRLGWSDRLMRCLDTVDEDIVLYAQEDYFLKEPVDVEMLDQMVRLMRHDGLSHISLVRGQRTGTPSRYEFLDCIDQRSNYRISAQAGLWQVPVLKSYLRRHETVWELEWYGSRRARRRPDSFFFVNRHYEESAGRRFVFPYRGTGVVHGKWVQGIVGDLFATHGIDVDYSQRGFLDHSTDDWSRPPALRRAVRRLRSLA
jgi:hypothetical protein